ncbi:MAG: hypothetical protein K2N13_00565 [Paraprevotella sp.]|nr:hypothetical protein [Paraprevotella sp.]
MENIQELEEMRSLLSVLNRKIEKETIINDRLMRRSMRTGLSFLRQKYLFIVVLCIIMIPNYFFLCRSMGLSMVFWMATTGLFLTTAAYTLYVNSYLNGSDIMNGNLLDVRRKVAKSMKLEHDWLRIGIPMVAVWMVWYCYEIFSTQEGDRAVLLFSISVGFAVGLCFGLRFRRRLLDTYRDILAQIDEVAA